MFLFKKTKKTFSLWTCLCWGFLSFLFFQTLDVHKQLNCCTGILLESFDQLKTIDSNKKGLLYGVPVSIKENFEYKVILGHILPPPYITCKTFIYIFCSPSWVRQSAII